MIFRPQCIYNPPGNFVPIARDRPELRHQTELRFTQEQSDNRMANYAKGAQVEHSKFGFGTVESHTDDRIEIKFDDHGTKKFVAQMALSSLKKSDRTPPVEKRATRARKPKVAPVAAPAAQ